MLSPDTTPLRSDSFEVPTDPFPAEGSGFTCPNELRINFIHKCKSSNQSAYFWTSGRFDESAVGDRAQADALIKQGYVTEAKRLLTERHLVISRLNLVLHILAFRLRQARKMELRVRGFGHPEGLPDQLARGRIRA
jgi:hypothetical protein